MLLLLLLAQRSTACFFCVVELCALHKECFPSQKPYTNQGYAQEDRRRGFGHSDLFRDKSSYFIPACINIARLNSSLIRSSKQGPIIHCDIKSPAVRGSRTRF